MKIHVFDSRILSFSGEWDQDVKVSGLIILRIGDKYEGQLFNDVNHGKGVYTYVSGNVYQGDFKNGHRQGSGILTYANGEKYDGSFDKDKKHGIGEYRCANGIIHKGSFANGHPNGICLMWFPDGSLYQGDSKDGCWDGLLIKQSKSTGVTDYLELKDGLIEGLHA